MTRTLVASATRALLVAVAAASILQLALPAAAQEPIVLYDNFNSSLLLNPRKWNGHDFGTRLEVLRAVQGVVGAAAARFEVRGYGATTDNTGSRSAGNFLVFPHPNPAILRAIRATFIVQAVQVLGTCAPQLATNGPVQARAEMFGYFFNTGPRVPGTSRNDVIARMRIRRLSNSADPPNVLRIQANVIKCLDNDCNNAQTLFNNSNVAVVTVGVPVTLRLDWQPGANRFRFQVNSNAAILAPYAVADTLPPGNTFPDKRRIGLGHFLPNCTTGPRPTAFMRVLVDNVFVNTAALITAPETDEPGAEGATQAGPSPEGPEEDTE